MDEDEVPVAIGLGSNLGDRLAHLREGAQRIGRLLRDARCSPVYASRAQGVGSSQPDYLNAVIVGRTRLTPLELLESARAIEARAGRERPYTGAPRTLDVDIVLYGERRVNERDLRIPHPEWARRAFVLAPLSRVAPGWRDPETGRTVLEVWTAMAPELPPVRPVAPSSALLRASERP